MKKIVLATVLTLVTLYAENTVTYDTRDVKDSGINKPNHPNSDIHSGR